MQKIYAIGILVLGMASVSFAAKSSIGFDIEPIVGYERTQKLVPTPHSKDRLTYGARLRVGVPLLSAEAEYLRAQDTEDFPTDNLSIKETTQRAKIGAVSALKLTKILSFSVRAGVQATMNQIDETENGVTTSRTEPLRYNPYAGAGLKVRLGRNASLNGEIVTVFKNFPNMNDNEYQTTLGFAVKYP